MIVSTHSELSLHFGDEAFVPVLFDADNTLQKLLADMVGTNNTEGTIAIRIDIELVQDIVENADPTIEGDTRVIRIPKITHKVSSVMQVKNEIKGDKTYMGYELALDSERGEYVLRPVVSSQQTIWGDEDGD